MLEENPRAQSVTALPHADVIPLVQFYSIELASLSDGRVFVGIGATLCEGEGELSNMEILSRHRGSRRAGALNHPGAHPRRPRIGPRTRTQRRPAEEAQ